MLRKKSYSTIWLCIVIAISIPLGLKGQGIQSISPSIPTSPQAEAFKQYGDYAINYSTGVPDISIPLYEINHRGYKLPLVLSYNPRPLKPGYNYDVYGHGWGLSVHSSVSRSIESCPDEWRDFKIDHDITRNYYHNPPHFPYPESIPVSLEGYNFAHDKFNVTLPNGSSFDFIIDRGHTNQLDFIISDGRHVKITFIKYNSKIESFTIVDEDGVIYTFEGSDTPFGDGINYNAYVSWQLTRIDLPHTDEPIKFNYSYVMQSTYQQWCYEPSILIEHRTTPELEPEPGFSGIIANATEILSPAPVAHKMKLLSSIIYGSNHIVFDYQNPAPTAKYNYVNKITVRENSSTIREITFGRRIITYFNHCDSNLPLAKLDTITIQGSVLDANPQVYSFNYHNVSGFSGTDHWGYLNSHQTRDVANFNFFVGCDVVYHGIIGGLVRLSLVEKAQNNCKYDKVKLSLSNIDNRQPNYPSNHGVLTKITYPTGGYTEFDFENHKFLTSTDPDGNYIFNRDNRIEARAAGFRIRKITNCDSDGTVTKIMHYRYGKTYGEIYGPDYVFANSHSGLGEAVVDPNILTYMNFSHYFHNNEFNVFFVRNMILGLNENGENLTFCNRFNSDPFLYEPRYNWAWECTFSPHNFRRIVNGRPPVLYPEVTVYYGEQNGFAPEKISGKTVYRYQITEPGVDELGFDGVSFGFVIRDDVFIEAPRYYKNTIYYAPQSFRYNKPIEMLDYKSDGQKFLLVKREVYDYFFNYQYSPDLVGNNAYPKKQYPPEAVISDYLAGIEFTLGVGLLASKRTDLLYDNMDSTSIYESYNYNTRNQLKTKTMVNSNNKTVETTFFYPETIPYEPTPDIIQKMLAKNVISPVIKSTTKVGTSSQMKETHGSRVDYKEFTIGDSKILMPAQSFELAGNEYVPKDEIISYSVNGNPLEYLSKDGIRSSIIWGYNDRYMVVKADNMDSIALAGHVAASLPSGFSTLEALLSSFTTLPNTNWDQFNNNLRNRVASTNTMVTTYTYSPLIGVTSTTDPNNISTYYYYDSFGRLEYLKDHEDNIVQQYEYHYQNQ